MELELTAIQLTHSLRAGLVAHGHSSAADPVLATAKNVDAVPILLAGWEPGRERGEGERERGGESGEREEGRGEMCASRVCKFAAKNHISIHL